MSFQIWSVPFAISAVSVFLVLTQAARISGNEARASRIYYALCLVSILGWDVAATVMQNLPAELAGAANLLNRAANIFPAFAVLFYAVSSIYFTRRPHLVEALVVSLPAAFVTAANFFDPFPVVITKYGWQGDISNPTITYGVLALETVVIIYAISRLFLVRSRSRNAQARRSLTYFIASALLAFVLGITLYFLGQLVPIPNLSGIAINFSFLLAYLAFLPRRAKRPHDHDELGDAGTHAPVTKNSGPAPQADSQARAVKI